MKKEIPCLDCRGQGLISKFNEKSAWLERCQYGDHADRLAAIEDILGDEYDLDELKEVVQAKREGRCVVLPCKIGDTLYRIQRFKRGKNRRKEAEFIRTVELNRNNFWRIVMDGEIGKTVFLTRAEAEAALRREQDG